MEEHLKITIRTYDEIAKEYMNTTYTRQPRTDFDTFCQAIAPNGLVLDVGCAGGRDCRALTERGFSVIGIDLSEEMLKLARNFAPTCAFIYADLRNIPYEDHYFDAIWCCASLLHLKRNQISQAFEEFKRVLKINAVCCIIVKKGTGEGIETYGNAEGKPRFFTYFQENEIREQCLSQGFDILEEHTTNERQSGRDQDWIYFLTRNT